MVASRFAGGMGTRWYFIWILDASAPGESALKNIPCFTSTQGGAGIHFSRATASASKIDQIGPPPFVPSPIPASAAGMRLAGLYLTFLALRGSSGKYGLTVL